jgi:hypothetical protein
VRDEVPPVRRLRSHALGRPPPGEKNKRSWATAQPPCVHPLNPSHSPLLSVISYPSPHTHVGKDASEDFDEIGHSNAAKEQLAQYYLGDFEGGGLGGPARIDKAAGAVKAGLPAGPVSPLVRALQFLLPLLAVLAAVLLPKVLS